MVSLIVPSISATPTNFTEFAAYGDAWIANNDTHTLVKWNATGTHEWVSTGNASILSEYLVVAGGGGGGAGATSYIGGGGGGGGFLNGTQYSVSGVVSVVVGTGGTGGVAAAGTKGGNSTFGNLTINITANGGGGGGRSFVGVSNGAAGGSGGGAGGYTGSVGGAGNTPSTVPAQGYSGANPPGAGSGGGGGGAYAAATTSAGAYGRINNITGINTIYSRGGAGNGSFAASGAVPAAQASSTGYGGNGGWAASGGAGGSGTIIILYATPGVVVAPVASFTDVTNPSTVGTATQYTDTSTNTPTGWDWGWDDGTANSTTQNPTHTYTSIGTYQVFLNVSNSYGFNSTVGYHTVVNATGFNQQDVTLTPSFTVTMHITDSTTGAPIPVVLVQDSNLQEYTTTNGTAYFTESYGTVVFYLSATGYTSKAVSYIIDEDRTVTVQMVPSASVTENTNTVYTQHFIGVRVVDLYRRPLSPVTVTAYYQNSSLPAGADIDYLTKAFGVNSEIAASMLNSSAALVGTTGSDGKVGMVMFPAIQYVVQAVNSSQGVACQMTMYPTDSDYLMYCPTASQSVAYNNTATQIAGSYVWITEPNKSYVTFNAQYQDPYGITTDLWFNVTCADNKTLMFSSHPGNPGTSVFLSNFTLPNVRGTQINAYLKYNRSGS